MEQAGWPVGLAAMALQSASIALLSLGTAISATPSMNGRHDRTARAVEGGHHPAQEAVTNHGRWAWLGGSSYLQTRNDLASPSGRCGAMSWSADGLLYLFGGTSSTAFMGDLWTFDYAKARAAGKPEPADWQFQGGSRDGNTNGTETWPAARQYATSWTDAEGGLWLWSGFGSRSANDSAGGYLDDLWRYDVVQKRWARQRSVGSNSGEVPSGKTWANQWTTQEGDLFVFSGFNEDTKIHNDMWRFRSARRSWEMVYNYSYYRSVNTTVHNKTKTTQVSPYDSLTLFQSFTQRHTYCTLGWRRSWRRLQLHYRRGRPSGAVGVRAAPRGEGKRLHDGR